MDDLRIHAKETSKRLRSELERMANDAVLQPNRFRAQLERNAAVAESPTGGVAMLEKGITMRLLQWENEFSLAARDLGALREYRSDADPEFDTCFLVDDGCAPMVDED